MDDVSIFDDPKMVDSVSGMTFDVYFRAVLSAEFRDFLAHYGAVERDVE